MEAPTLDGYVAVVTGSSRGIGATIASVLAADGCAVVVNSLHSVSDGQALTEQIRSSGGAAAYIQADVSNYDGARLLIEAAKLEFGRIDILINNADWYEPLAFVDNDEDYWDRVIRAGMYSAINSTHSALSALAASERGRIVTIAGDSGRVGLAQGAVHSGAMAALIAMTKSWAKEFAQYGIRVNAVSPGPIATEMWNGILRSDYGETMVRTEFDSLFGIGEPADVANAVLFFAGDRANHITGQTLSVNGGRAFPS